MKQASWLMVLVLSTPAWAQTTKSAPPATQAALPALLRQLGADDWQQRDQAQAEIVRIGGDALPTLRDLTKTTPDEEVRQRVFSAIRKIEDEQLAGQSLLTLDMTDVPADQVFAEIARQSFAQLPLRVSDDWRANVPRLTIKADRRPFWEVMRTVCPKAGLHPEWRGDAMVMVDGYRNELDGRVVIGGPFLVMLKKADRTTSITRGQAGRFGRMSFQATVMAEPKLQVIGRAGAVTIKKAIDDQDRALQPQQYYSGMSAGPQGTFPLTMVLSPEPDAVSLKALVCEMPILLGLRPTTITIDQPLEAGAKKHRVNSTDVVIGPMRLQGNVYHLTIECDQQLINGGAQNITNALRVFDDKGNAFQQQGFRQSQITAQGKFLGELAYNPPVAGSVPDKIVCSVQSEVREITLNFSFADVPLP